MRYLVDAYNLLFRTLKKKGNLEKNRQRMIEELNDAAADARLKLTLVFDGADTHFPYSSRGHFDAIELVYTPKSMSADAYISEEVALSKTPSQITVVTNDRELAIRCRSYRALILSIDAFVAFVAKKKAKAKKRPLRVFRSSDREISRLLTIFEQKLKEELEDN
jgi:predicted RNA-binding protein with PIN domain